MFDNGLCLSCFEPFYESKANCKVFMISENKLSFICKQNYRCYEKLCT